MSSVVTYDEFVAQWLSEIRDDEKLSSIERGRKFALKLISQWLDFSEDTTVWVWQQLREQTPMCHKL